MEHVMKSCLVRDAGGERLSDYDEEGNLIHEKFSSDKKDSVSEKWVEYGERHLHVRNSSGYEEWYNFDGKGNLIVYGDTDGHERFCGYDSNGKILWEKSSGGYAGQYEYNSRGQVIRYTDSEGHEVNFRYDKNGNMVYCRDPLDEVWQKYDGNGNVILMKSRKGIQKSFFYDESGLCVREVTVDAEGHKSEVRKSYDVNGRLVCEKDSSKGVTVWDYDAKGNLLHFKSPEFEEWNSYDRDGNLLSYRNGNGYFFRNEFDADGNCVHWKNSLGDEEWHRFDSDGNEVWMKSSDGLEVKKEWWASRERNEVKDKEDIRKEIAEILDRLEAEAKKMPPVRSKKGRKVSYGMDM